MLDARVLLPKNRTIQSLVRFSDAIGTFQSLVSVSNAKLIKQLIDGPFLLENKEDVASSIIKDGPVPWCRNDQLTFVSEQVSHHPPSKIKIQCQCYITVSLITFNFSVSAFYAEHHGKRISFSAHVWTKSKFLGLSIGVHNIGQGVVTLCDLNEDYELTFPNGYGRWILDVKIFIF